MNKQDEEDGEITTVASATTTSKSLRSTIPRGIVRQFGLSEGDRLRWFIKAQDNKLVITVEPILTKKK
jgi:bifunctional DNA-binding transcriptional regulator/antitoxin component of YhaV-PrlF toxin-antitoxin module